MPFTSQATSSVLRVPDNKFYTSPSTSRSSTMTFVLDNIDLYINRVSAQVFEFFCVGKGGLNV